MSENQVERIQTPVSAATWTVAAILAWHDLFGSYPSEKSLAVLYGQYMVETGGSACWNYNLGNVKHVDGDGHDWIDLPGASEYVNGQRVFLEEGNPGRRFVAYENLEKGMRSYLSMLHDRRYKSSWPYVANGDPRGFVHAIKAQGYFTADETAYANIVVSRYNDYINHSYYEDAVKAIGVTSDTGKESPSDSAPVSPEADSLTQSGDTSPVVDFDIIHKSPFDEEV